MPTYFKRLQNLEQAVLDLNNRIVIMTRLAAHNDVSLIQPICQDETMNDMYLWDINAGGVELVVHRDDPHKLRVRTGHAGEEKLDLSEVDKLYEALGMVRAWLEQTRHN